MQEADVSQFPTDLQFAASDIEELNLDSTTTFRSSRRISTCRRDSLLTERRTVENLAERETRKIRFWRRTVLLAMASIGAFGTAMAYIFLRNVDQNDFEASFGELSNTIRDSTTFNLRGLIEATNGIAQVFTSQAIKTNSQFPFMTLSSFEVFVKNSWAEGSTELLVIAPLVNSTDIPAWNDYAIENQRWLDESFEEYEGGRSDFSPIPSSVYRFGKYKGRVVLKEEDGKDERYPVAPFWQMSPPPFDTSIINLNALSVESYQQMYDAMIQTNHWVMGSAGPNEFIDYTMSVEQHDELHAGTEITSSSSNTNTSEPVGFANEHPHTPLLFPVYRDKDPSHPSGSNVESPIVAMILNEIAWDAFLQRILPRGVNGVDCVLHNSAGQAFTYHLRGPQALYLGPEDLHEQEFEKYKVLIDFEDILFEEADSKEDMGVQTRYWFAVYPSKELQKTYETTTPIIFSVAFAAIYLVMVLAFVFYDALVRQKSNIMTEAATHANAILASLFPKNIKKRLLEDKAAEIRAMFSKQKKNKKPQSSAFLSSLTENAYESSRLCKSSKPIADVFEEATVLFADLVGFTAWSSTREPTDVFVLLETLYQSFDKIAKIHDVYKVETIGDCYVAVAGCPTPNPDHHVCMVRFAMECMKSMKLLVQMLERELGPDTSTLEMRFGLHSGPVTGGVLRGERGRFQLFGDTMNTAARLESNGKPGKIHLSEATANLLIASGKESWIVEREDKIVAKGKGQMTTFWIGKSHCGRDSNSIPDSFAGVWADTSESSGQDGSDHGSKQEEGVFPMCPSTLRVVDWTTTSLMSILERLTSQRNVYGLGEASHKSALQSTAQSTCGTPLDEQTPLDEMQDVSSFHFYPFEILETATPLLGQEIEDQLRLYVGTIASLSNSKTSYHGFDHASHVIQSVLKFFSRMSSIGTKTSYRRFSAISSNRDFARRLSQRHLSASTTSAVTVDQESHIDISKDPLAVFACAFAALIHDVEHPGVPNNILRKENPALASIYKERSIAEQRSFTTSWDLLHEKRFNDLRLAICPNSSEASRFRQLVINALMATDIFDPELQAARSHSWSRAFGSAFSIQEEESPKQMLDLKATIVLQHLMQASDLCHAMQHWHIYQQWNAKLYEETFQAFFDGRCDKDPSLYWYEGEIDFFDKYVIPLATRINQIGCFGSFGEECLQKALQNKEEWRERGLKIVKQLRASVAYLCGDDEPPTSRVNSVNDLEELEEEFKADLEKLTEALGKDGGMLDGDGNSEVFEVNEVLSTSESEEGVTRQNWADSMDFSAYYSD